MHFSIQRWRICLSSTASIKSLLLDMHRNFALIPPRDELAHSVMRLLLLRMHTLPTIRYMPLEPLSDNTQRNAFRNIEL